jgi:hypothetical protein
MAQIVEVLLPQSLSFGVTELLLRKGVVDDLESLPVTLTLQKLVHLLLSRPIASGHNPSVELEKPYLFEEDLYIV